MQNPYLPDGCTQAALDAAHEEPEREYKIAALWLTRNEWDRLADMLATYVDMRDGYYGLAKEAREWAEAIDKALEES